MVSGAARAVLGSEPVCGRDGRVLKEEQHFRLKDLPTSNETRASRLPLINKLAHQESP